MYEQCMDLQLFYRDTEQADTWMTKQEVNNFIYIIDLIDNNWLHPNLYNNNNMTSGVMNFPF